MATPQFITRTAIALAMVGVHGCLGPFEKDRCDGVLSEFVPGLYVTGASVGPDGRGYLDGYAAVGDCFGYQEAKTFRFDVNSHETTTSETDFLLGRVVVDAATGAGLATGYVDPLTEGMQGGYGAGARLLSASSDAPIDVGSTVWDIEPTSSGGWVVSAGAAGGWEITASGATSKLLDDASYCCAQSATTDYFCVEGGVSMSSNGAVSVLGLGERPHTIAAVDSGFIFVLDSAIGVARDGVIEVSVPLEGGNTSELWVAPDERHAVVRRGWDTYLFNVETSALDRFSGAILTDVAFTADSRYVLYAQQLSIGVHDLETGEVDSFPVMAPTDVFLVRIGPRRFLRLRGSVENIFRIGDTVSGVFQEFEVEDEDSIVLFEPWDLQVTE